MDISLLTSLQRQPGSRQSVASHSQYPLSCFRDGASISSASRGRGQAVHTHANDCTAVGSAASTPRRRQQFVQFVCGGFVLSKLLLVDFWPERQRVALKGREKKKKKKSRRSGPGDSVPTRPILVGRADLKLPGLLPNAFFTDGGVAGRTAAVTDRWQDSRDMNHSPPKD